MIAALLGASLLAACALRPKLEPPQLSIAGVQLVRGELWAQRFKLRLRVHNPNDRELAVKGIEFALEVAGQEFARGESAARFVVPPHGDAEFDTNVSANLAGAALKILSRGPGALTEEVPYRLSGKVSLAEGLWRSIPFDDHGTFKP